MNESVFVKPLFSTERKIPGLQTKNKSHQRNIPTIETWQSYGLGKEQPFVVWGLGEFIKILISKDSVFRKKLAGIVDRNMEPGEFQGIRIFRPEHLPFRPKTVLIGSIVHEDDIYADAKRLYGDDVACYGVYCMKNAVSTQNVPPFLMTTVPRSGTHWLASMMNHIGFKGVSRPAADVSDQQIHSECMKQMPILKNGFFFYDHLRYRKITSVLNGGRIKVLLLIRDPRDCIVSNYCFVKYKVGNSHLGGFYEHFFKTIGELKTNYTEWAQDWLQYTSLHLVRYERLTENTRVELEKIIEFLGLKESPDLASIVEQHSFIHLSSGRAAGDEDRSHHYRKGISGDWVNWFTPEIEKTYFEKMGDVHRKLGY